MHTLAVTSTPSLSSRGQSEELGSDGATPPNEGGGISVQPPAGVGPEISGRNWGDSLPCPILPKAVMTPPDTLAATSPKRDQIVANPQLSWWEEEEADQADGREGDPMGMSTEHPTRKLGSRNVGRDSKWQNYWSIITH